MVYTIYYLFCRKNSKYQVDYIFFLKLRNLDQTISILPFILNFWISNLFRSNFLQTCQIKRVPFLCFLVMINQIERDDSYEYQGVSDDIEVFSVR